MSYQFVVGKSYNFETYAAAILGTQYQGVLVMAEMDYNTAIQHRDVTATHHQIYGALPAGTPDDPASTTYLRLKLPSGDVTILGKSWIKDETVVETQSGEITVKITNAVPDDVNNVRDQLTLAGYSADQFTIVYKPFAYAEL